MEKVEQSKLEQISFLFDQNKYDQVITKSVLMGYFGSAMVNDLHHPQVARLDAGEFTVFGGDPHHPDVVELIQAQPIFFVTAENEAWSEVLQKALGKTPEYISFTAYSSNQLDKALLQQHIDRLDHSYSVVRMDEALCVRVPEALGNEYFFEMFDSTADFLDRGIGFCILQNDDIVAAATSMASAGGVIDIEIETDPSHRRKGLGAAVGAQLVLYCLENDIVPMWLAANPDSERLAERLGFVPAHKYQAMSFYEE